MRGALAWAAVRKGLRGIIPADAGSTLQKIVPKGSAWDHPRGCGEHT